MGVVLFYTTYNSKKIARISRKHDDHGARGGRCFTFHKAKRLCFMLGKRAMEYADIPSEFNDAESARFLLYINFF